MAQTVFERIVATKQADDRFRIDSAGLGAWHEGEQADARMRACASRRGYEITHLARPVRPHDFDSFDYIVGMDESNIRELQNRAGTKAHRAKIRRMTDFLQRLSANSIPDPYYNGIEGFEHVIDLLEDACDGFYRVVSGEEKGD